jgi:hypothetical protein
MPSGTESLVELPAIAWIGATLPVALAAKPRIAFEPALEIGDPPLRVGAIGSGLKDMSSIVKKV